MPDPVGGRAPLSTLARPSDADLMIDAAAARARVDTNEQPVGTFGPSLEELKLSQQAAVVQPVQTLVERFRSRSATERLALLRRTYGELSDPRTYAIAVARVFVSVWSAGAEEGHDLNLARIRDAKVLAFLQLGKRSLGREFLTTSSKARVDGTGEAAQILAQLDRLPRLRGLVTAEVERGIATGRAATRELAVTDSAGLRAVLERGAQLTERRQPPRPNRSPLAALSAADAKIVEFTRRYRRETPFRLGALAAVSGG